MFGNCRDCEGRARTIEQLRAEIGRLEQMVEDHAGMNRDVDEMRSIAARELLNSQALQRELTQLREERALMWRERSTAIEAAQAQMRGQLDVFLSAVKERLAMEPLEARALAGDVEAIHRAMTEEID